MIRIVTGIRKHAVILLLCLSALAASCIILAMQSDTASADSPYTQTGEAGENVKWTYSRMSGSITFSGTGEMYDYEILTDDPNDPRAQAPKWSNFDVRTAVFSEGITHVGKSALRYNRSVTSISLPSTLESIGQNAFSGTKIQTITIPSSVTSIDTLAFSNSALTSITIPDTVTYLGPSAFAKCRYLTHITLGEGITEINQGLFANTPALESVELGSNVQRIGRWLTTDSGLESITVPASVIWISSSAFSARSADSLKEVIVEDGNAIYSSENGVLYDREKTELIRFLPAMETDSFEIPDTVRYLGDNSFLYAENLEHVTLPDGLEFIGLEAFSLCTSLKEMVIPDSVTQIAKNGIATGGTLDLLRVGEGIRVVTMATIPSLSDVRVIEVGTSVEKLDTSALHGNPSLEYVDVHKDSLHYASADGILYNANMTQLLVAPCRKTGSASLPGSVTHVADNAFLNSGLDNVVLSGNIQVLGNGSFRNSSLKAIIIPDTVKIIGNEAFEGCSDLKFVYFVGQNPPSMGYDAFSTGGGLRVYSSMQRGFVDAYSSDSMDYYESEVFYSDAADMIMHGQYFVVGIILAAALTLIAGEYLVRRRHGRN